MTKSLLRALCASLATATVFSFATPASAATLTFTDNNCAGFSITGSAPNFTLVCQSLACTLSAVPAAPAPGQASTMTASCTGGGAVSYSNWTSVTGGACPLPVSGGGASATVTSASAVGPCTYRVTGSDGALSGTATASVTWSSTPPSAPSGCTLTASSASLAAAGSVTLTAACAGGGAPTSYAWSGAGTVTPTAANSQVVNVAATTTFSVTPSNGGGNGNSASATVTVGGGGSGIPATCTVHGVTYNVLDVNAQNSIGTLPFSTRTISSGFNGSKVLIATLVPPAGVSTNTKTLAVYEYGAPSTSRQAWLARSPCDWSGTGAYYQQTSGPVFNYTIGGADPSAVNMKVGETWYLIVVNQKPFFTGNSCSSGTCDVGITWAPPN